MQKTAQPEEDNEDDCRCSRRGIVVENELHCYHVTFSCVTGRKNEPVLDVLCVVRLKIDKQTDRSRVFIFHDQAEGHRESPKILPASKF